MRFESRRGCRLLEDGGGEKVRVLTIDFELDGQKFTAPISGPMHQFTEAISLVVRCDPQEEIDHYWWELPAGGAEIQYGWLQAKFGPSWRIVPARLSELIQHPQAKSS